MANETCGRAVNEAERTVDAATLPAWAIRLAYRVAQLEHGRAYNVTVIKANQEPSWTVQPMGKVENGG